MSMEVLKSRLFGHHEQPFKKQLPIDFPEKFKLCSISKIPSSLYLKHSTTVFVLCSKLNRLQEECQKCSFTGTILKALMIAAITRNLQARSKSMFMSRFEISKFCFGAGLVSFDLVVQTISSASTVKKKGEISSLFASYQDPSCRCWMKPELQGKHNDHKRICDDTTWLSFEVQITTVANERILVSNFFEFSNPITVLKQARKSSDRWI